MKLKEFYQGIVNIGIESDPRGKKAIAGILKQRKQQYQKLDKEAKEFFDQETLTNPYNDTRIVYGSPEASIKKILVGIDIDTAELLLAHTLNKSGYGIDLVVSHHPDPSLIL